MSFNSFRKEVLAPIATGIALGSIICSIVEEYQKRKREREQVIKILREVREALVEVNKEAKAMELNQTQED